jgi:uncharacterized protein YbcI
MSANNQRVDQQHTISPLALLSNELVHLYKEQFGRGPTHARAFWCSEDVLTVVLEDTFTPAERNLVKMGAHARLREQRTFFQYATVRGFCEPVERLTGRRVRAFVSGIDTQAAGLSVETYVLYPHGETGPSRADLAETEFAQDGGR